MQCIGCRRAARTVVATETRCYAADGGVALDRIDRGTRHALSFGQRCVIECRSRCSTLCTSCEVAKVCEVFRSESQSLDAQPMCRVMFHKEPPA